MYIKINTKDQFTKIIDLFAANKFSINNNLKQELNFVPEFVFVIKDVLPLTSKTRQVIWDGCLESVRDNYWDADLDFNSKIYPFATSNL